MTTEPRASGHLPDAMRGSSQLMDAQCWLWGQDIRRPGGNLLIAYGLRRCRWESGGHATYYRGNDDDSTVVLWAGGMLLADAGSGVLVLRQDTCLRLRPGLRPEDPCPDPRRASHEPEGPALPLDDSHVSAAFLWMRDYERWVATEAPDWRAECAVGWLEAEQEAHRLASEVGVEYELLPPLPPEGLGESWNARSSLTAAGPSCGRGPRLR